MYRKNTKGWLKHLDFLIWDLLLLELAFFIVYAYRIGVFFPFSPLYQRMVIAIVPAHLITVFFGNSYRDMIRRDRYAEFKKVCVHSFVVIALLIFWMFLSQNSYYYSRLLVVFDVACFGGAGLYRAAALETRHSQTPA